jgi:hypothetical protein
MSVIMNRTERRDMLLCYAILACIAWMVLNPDILREVLL